MSLTEDSFIDEIAPARTFTFLKEVEMLRQNGLALGGSLDNAIVISDTGVLNSSLRFEDEFVRHKILDLVGDFALLGHPIIAHAVVHRGGHALHTAMAAQLLEQTSAWSSSRRRRAPRASARQFPRQQFPERVCRSVGLSGICGLHFPWTHAPLTKPIGPSSDDPQVLRRGGGADLLEPGDPFVDQIELQLVSSRRGGAGTSIARSTVLPAFQVCGQPRARVVQLDERA